MGLFTTFYDAPSPNQVWVQNKDGKRVVKFRKHHEESWVELFIDLIYVGLFITLSLSFKECSLKEGISLELMVSSATLILLMFTFRISIDSYSNRFFSDDLFGRLLYLGYGYGLAFMVLNTDGSDEVECHRLGMQTDGFIIGYMMCRFINLVVFGTAMFAYPAVIPQYAYVFTVKCAITFFSFSMFGFRDGRPTFLLVSCIIEFLLLVPVQAFANKFVVTTIFRYPEDVDVNLIPLNETVAQRRLCMWVMMVLGESVIQFVEPSIDQSSASRAYWFFTAGIILIFTFALLYCDSVLRENLDLHAFRRSPSAAGLWTWMHPVVGYTLFCIGVSIKMCFYSVVHDVPVKNEHNFMLGISCGCTLIFLGIMRGTHKGINVILSSGCSTTTLKRLGNYIVRLMFALAHFVVASQSRDEEKTGPNDRADSRDYYLYAHAAISAASVLVEMIAARLNGKAQRAATKLAHEHHSESEEMADSVNTETKEFSSQNPLRKDSSVEMSSVLHT